MSSQYNWNTPPLYPSMLQESLISRLREISATRDAKISKIKNRQDAEQYARTVHRKIRSCFGQLPKKTALNLKIVREDKRDGYTRQNVIFESRPGYFVSACIYIPDGNEKTPAVLGVCGHSPEGKARDFYQAYCIGLVKQGYLVLITDPVSQGERWQYKDDTLPGKVWQGKRSVYEHNNISKTQSLVGEFFGTWRLWDNIRGLDVLLSHPRVDISRIGVTGISGGGTLSNYIFAFDKRINFAAPGCYITTFLHNLENSLPCDAEQMIPKMLKYGLEMGDLLIARAPSPVIVLAEKYDFFDVRGAEEFYLQARKIYKLLGAEKNFQLFIGDGGHGYHRPLREAMYAFFNKHSGVKSSTDEDILKVSPEPEENLYSANGDVDSAGSRFSWEFTAEKARLLKEVRPKLSMRAKLKCLENLLRLPKRKGICHYRNSQLKKYRLIDDNAKYAGQTHYLVETQPGIMAVLCRFKNKEISPQGHCLNPPKELELFIPDRSAEAEVNISDGTVMGKRIQDAWIVEPRGMGNTMPRSLEGYSFDDPYGLDYMFAATYEMLGESMMGNRVHDVLCVLDLLVSKGTKRITLTGSGLGAMIATFAGALHKNVTKVNITDSPPSYFEMTQISITPENTSYMVTDILKHFDWIDFL